MPAAAAGADKQVCRQVLEEWDMNWLVLLLFEVLWTMEDCRDQQIGKHKLLLGLAAGSVSTVWMYISKQSSLYLAAAGSLPGVLLLAWSVVTEEKIGKADGLMVLAAGLFVGWRFCTAILAFACLLAAGYAGVGILRKKIGRTAKISFAPFLLAATLVIRILSIA